MIIETLKNCLHEKTGKLRDFKTGYQFQMIIQFRTVVLFKFKYSFFQKPILTFIRIFPLWKEPEKINGGAFHPELSL
jgi:hypothetical protein